MPSEATAGMTLGELQAAGIDGRIIGSAAQRVSGVQHDSRGVRSGDLFVAVPGATHDGVRFAADAVARGAVAVMAESEVDSRVPQLIVSDARRMLGRAAELVYGSPSSALRTVGITGTNGKTTTAYLLKQGIEGAGGRAALIGTTGLIVGNSERSGLHTTPEGDDISRFARESADRGATHLVLEVSSHGLSLQRVDALRFQVAAFTNLSQDHLDFHGDLRAYGEAKARLFTQLGPTFSVINVDDAFGAALVERSSGRVIRCSRRADADAEIVAMQWSATREGIRAEVRTPAGALSLRSPMLGEHNLENILVALGCAHALGLDLERVAAAWETAAGSPGRLERVPHPGDVAVLVDYAHTPDALERVLDTMRQVTARRLFVVFGAGGDRDKGKRREMGRIGVERADLCVLTSDNPRTEDPRAILAEVEAGARAAGAERVALESLPTATRGYCSVLDRRAAIQATIAAATAGDTVLLAGKGHETYQILGEERTHFDDREEARAAIAAQGGAV